MAVFIGFMFTLCVLIAVVVMFILLVKEIIEDGDHALGIATILAALILSLSLSLLALSKAENNERRHITTTQINAVE